MKRYTKSSDCNECYIKYSDSNLYCNKDSNYSDEYRKPACCTKYHNRSRNSRFLHYHFVLRVGLDGRFWASHCVSLRLRRRTDSSKCNAICQSCSRRVEDASVFMIQWISHDVSGPHRTITTS